MGVVTISVVLRHPDPRLALLEEDIEAEVPAPHVVGFRLHDLCEGDGEVLLEFELRIEADESAEARGVARRWVEDALARHGTARFADVPGAEIDVHPITDDDLEEERPRPADFVSRLVPTRWHRSAALDDGRRLRIVAHMGAPPLERVEVAERDDAVVVSLLARWPPRYGPNGEEYGVFAVGISVTFDILLPTPLGSRRVIDGATGRDPNRRPNDEHDWLDARGRRLDDPARTVPLVPTWRVIDWEALTGRPWFHVEPSDREDRPPPAAIAFLTSSEDFGQR